MANDTFNPQSYAIRIEQKLRKHGCAIYGSADSIRKNPIGFIDDVLSHCGKQAEDFCEKYEKYNGDSFDTIGEEATKRITNDFINLFN